MKHRLVDVVGGNEVEQDSPEELSWRHEVELRDADGSLWRIKPGDRGGIYIQLGVGFDRTAMLIVPDRAHGAHGVELRAER